MTNLIWFQIVFYDMFNQRVLGGQYISFANAVLTARGITKNGFKSSWEIVRLSDGVILAQSKVAQS